jgi:hypothetical protein
MQGTPDWVSDGALSELSGLGLLERVAVAPARTGP